MKFYGKFRAIVTSIEDPDKRGRIKVKCPKVLGKYESAWCEPCVPFAYESGGDFYLPPINEAVWIEFEEGDPDKPIWVGGWWTKENTPMTDYTLKTKQRIFEFKGSKIVLKDDSLILIRGNASIEIKDDNINLTGVKVNVI